MINYNRLVVCAANRHPTLDALILGPRHWDETMRMQYDTRENMPPHSEFEQGFINTWGEFLTREEAWEVALRNDQIIRLVGSQRPEDMGNKDIALYSENLY